MLKERIISSVFLGAMVLGGFFLPAPGLLVILLLLCGLALWEFYSLLDAAGISNFRYVGMVGGLGIILSTWIGLYFRGLTLAYEWEWVLLIMILSAIFYRQFMVKTDPKPLETMASTLFGVMYVALMFNFITKLLMVWGERDVRLLVVYLIIVVKVTDMGAYFTGCAMGRHKLIPRISPGKTWEGCAGGVLAGVGASVLFSVLSGGHIGPVGLSIPHAIILGILLSISGIVGDLAESLLKRAAKVKDSGSLLRGMGGILDVLDSLLFAGPVLYVYARIFLPTVVRL